MGSCTGMATIATSFHEKEGKIGHCKKGTFVLLLKSAGDQIPRTPLVVTNKRTKLKHIISHLCITINRALY